MRTRVQCSNEICACEVAAEGLYCSKYCEQAAEHGIERNYCQCEHECIGVRPATEAVLSKTSEDSAPSVTELQLAR